MFSGLYTALITPFTKNGEIDKKALCNIVEKQIENNVHGLVPVGTTGESPTLSHKEHLEIIKIVIKQTKKRVPIIAGTGSNNTKEAIELTQAAKDIGANASLQVAPYYNKPSQKGFFEHFTAIANTVSLPHIIYNIPARSGNNIEVSTIRKLAKHKNIVGVKEATGNITQSIEILASIKHFSVLSGDDLLSLGILAHGGHGLISVASNVFPKELSTYISHAINGNMESATKRYNNLFSIFKVLLCDTNPIPIKYAASILKLCSPYYRLPLCPPSNAHKTLITTAIQNYVKGKRK